MLFRSFATYREHILSQRTGYLLLAVLATVSAAFIPAVPATAQTAFTLYEMLEPGSAKFKITYDVTTARAGAEFFLNPIRAGSVATDESVIDLATGQELYFEVINGRAWRKATV